MLDLATLKAKLQPLWPRLRSHHRVEALRVFGSVARGEAREGSNVDLPVAFAPGARVGLWNSPHSRRNCKGL